MKGGSYFKNDDGTLELIERSGLEDEAAEPAIKSPLKVVRTGVKNASKDETSTDTASKGNQEDKS